MTQQAWMVGESRISWPVSILVWLMGMSWYMTLIDQNHWMHLWWPRKILTVTGTRRRYLKIITLYNLIQLRSMKLKINMVLSCSKSLNVSENLPPYTIAVAGCCLIFWISHLHVPLSAPEWIFHHPMGHKVGLLIRKFFMHIYHLLGMNQPKGILTCAV